MPLRKAIEDLRKITLAALPGRWQKLLYFARLRRESLDKYSHWGFEQKYGKQAESALREAHASVYRDVLRAPLPELLEDSEETGVNSSLLNGEAADAMVPIEPEGQAESHFRYILATLKALLRAQKKPL
jgi:hypothetical protein